MTFDRYRIDRQDGDSLWPLIELGQPLRQCRPDSAGGLHGVGKLSWVGSPQHHHRNRGIASILLGDRDAYGGMRIDEMSRF